MTYPTKPEALALLKKWKADHDRAKKMLDDIKAVIGLYEKSPLSDSVWFMFLGFTESLGLLLGDKSSWLIWFYIENDMGREGRHAGYDGKTKPIKTVNQLYALIVKERKR